MVNLREQASNKPLGQITEEQLQYLVDNLEEEWLEDQDYAITQMLVDFLEQHGGDPALISVLRNALGGRDEIDVAWSR